MSGETSDCIAAFRESASGRFLRATRPVSQPLDDAHYLPAAAPPAAAVGTKRALRSAPVVLVRGVGMPAYAEAGAAIAM
jgi:hypothetical protein